MTGVRHYAVLVTAREALQAGLAASWGTDAISVSLKGDRRDSDRWQGRQAALDVIELWIAIDQSIAMPVRVDDDIDEIRKISIGPEPISKRSGLHGRRIRFFVQRGQSEKFGLDEFLQGILRR